MLFFEVRDLTTFLMMASLLFLPGNRIAKALKDTRSAAFFRWAGYVLFIASAAVLIWLPFNKELFHWHYDIATGVPVDHYSTYFRCLFYAGVATVFALIHVVMSLWRRK